MMFVDVHAHIDKFEGKKLLDIIANAENVGVRVIINNGIDPETNRKTLQLSSEFKIVRAALGLHPEFVANFNEKIIDEELKFIRKNSEKVVAIGEIGLDYYWVKDKTLLDKQRELFSRFLKLALNLKKVVIVHSRRAEADTIEVLESFNLKKVIMHCFGGNSKLVKRIIDNDWYISIPPIVVRSSHFQNIVRITPMSNLLTETDSPFLSPYKGKKNEPSFVVKSVKKIAEIKKLTQEETSQNIFLNYQRLFLQGE